MSEVIRTLAEQLGDHRCTSACTCYCGACVQYRESLGIVPDVPYEGESRGHDSSWATQRDEVWRRKYPIRPTALAVLRAENEELKQWMSDACELLHQLHARSREVHEIAAYEDPILDLLRRAENP